MDIAVNRLDIAFRSTSNFAKSCSPLADHELEERPPFGCQRLSQQVFRRE
jgi:hypothetical protein